MIKLPIPRHFLIEVPIEAKNVKLFTFGFVGRIEYEIYGVPYGINLPRGYYRLISANIANITEGEAKGIVPSFEEPKGCINYVDYVNGGKETKGDGKRSIVLGFSEALPALHSAFESVGVVWMNKLKEPNHLDYKWEKYKGELTFKSDLHMMAYGEKYDEYHTAQSLVKRFVLIEKEGADE